MTQKTDELRDGEIDIRQASIAKAALNMSCGFAARSPSLKTFLRPGGVLPLSICLFQSFQESGAI